MTFQLKFKGYRALLYGLLFILIALPALQGFAYISAAIGLLLIGILFVAVRAVANVRKQVYLSSIFGAAGVIGYFGNYFGFGAWLEGMGLLGFALFFLTVGSIILMNIMLHIRNVTEELICGSINVYLLVGLSFAFIHALVEFLQPGSITGLDSLSMGDGNVMPYLYFSFVTMTTLGYGDLSPVTGAAAGAVYIQAIFGQLYIAIMIARLMGLYVANEGNHGEKKENQKQGHSESGP